MKREEEQKFTTEDAGKKKFDFSKAEKGAYHFELNAEGRTFTKVVNF